MYKRWVNFLGIEPLSDICLSAILSLILPSVFSSFLLYFVRNMCWKIGLKQLNSRVRPIDRTPTTPKRKRMAWRHTQTHTFLPQWIFIAG
jgi:hypothetical protein